VASPALARLQRAAQRWRAHAIDSFVGRKWQKIQPAANGGGPDPPMHYRITIVSVAFL